MRSKLYTVKEAAEYLNVSDRTLRYWKHFGTGPAFHKLGGKVLYHKNDLDEFIAAGRFDPTEQAVAS